LGLKCFSLGIFFNLNYTIMYKVNLPLPGYGYCIGDETKHIAEEDAKVFLADKRISLIELVEPPVDKVPEPAKENVNAKKSVK
jgi:hypothetical protein